MAFVNHYDQLVTQLARIEPEVYSLKRRPIRYARLVPIDTSGPEWVRTILHFSSDGSGAMEEIANRGRDIPLVDVQIEKHTVTAEEAAIGYDYTMREAEMSMATGNWRPVMDKAMKCQRAADDYMERITFSGNVDHGWDGLLNSAHVTRTDAAANGSGDRNWKDKSASEIIRDINDALTKVYVDSNTVEMADTLLYPPSVFSSLSTAVLQGTAMTVQEFIARNNVYTQQTGMPLMMIGIPQLATAGNGSTGRMVVYRRAMDVLRLHMPMPFRFMEVHREIGRYVVPGCLRTAGLEIRLPKAMLYVDQIA